MPALFDVPGWSVSSAPVSTQRQSKKRKRTTSSDDQNLLRAAQANLDKLIDSLGGDGDPSLKKKNKTKHGKLRSSLDDQRKKSPHPPGRPHIQATVPVPVADPPATVKNVRKQTSKHRVQFTNTAKQFAATTGLTPLQQTLRKSLDGARFRLLNETLYKSNSVEAVKMMKEDPKNFKDYHIGFRRQVQSWSTNPVLYYISELSSYPARTVIADLGCGDAALARALLPKNLVVFSFDLVSDEAYVIEADICSHVPLPGSEPQSAEFVQGEAQVVDVTVCALSLMSTNWPKCIGEAWRILRPGGQLMIAEVASRFASVDQFISLVGSIGFKLQNKDDRNSYFTLFRFKKVARAVITDEAWSTLVSGGRILKSCEYKRR